MRCGGLTEAAEETLVELVQVRALVCRPLLQELQGLVSQKKAAHGAALHLLAKLGLLKLLQLSCKPQSKTFSPGRDAHVAFEAE